MNLKKYYWFRIAESINGLIFSKDNLAEVEVNGKRICIARQGGKIFACAATCPHAGGKLADGYIDALNNIVCPVHKYRFNINTGHNSSSEGYFLRIFPVEERPDGWYIRFEG